MRIVLSRPIKAHGEDVTELKFREPTAGDLRGIKLQLGEGGLTFETGAIIDLAAKLADVPPSSLDKLPLSEMVAIAGQVGPFLESLEKSLMPSSPTSSSAAE